MDESRARAERKVASLSHDKSGCGRDSRARAGGDAELGHAASGAIRVGAAPGKDGSAIDNQIPGANQPSTDGSQNTQDKERFR
jgi:hypothetical protein